MTFGARSSLAPLLLLGAITPTLAAESLCTSAEQVVFSCPVAKSRVISVCAVQSARGRSQITYRFGTSSKVELQLSADTAASPPEVEGNQSQGARGYDHFIRFKAGDFAYTVRDFWGGCPSPGQTRCPRDASFTGVLVTKSGRVIGRNPCVAPASAFPYEGLVRLAVPTSEDWPR